MNKKIKQYLILFSLLFILMLPNTALVLIGRDTVVFTFLKQLVFFVYTASFLLILFSLIKPKIFFGLMILFLPVALLDLYILLLTGTQSTSMHYAAVFSSNSEEAKELLSGNLLYIVFAVLFIGIYIWLFSRLDKNLVLNKKLRIGLSFISLIIIVGLFGRDYSIARNDKSTQETLDLTFGFFELKLDKTYPIGSINKLANVIVGIREKNRFENNIKSFSYQSEITSTEDKTIVLVIGEAARKHNFQLYEYHRKTNPELSKIKNLLIYKEVVANANFTQTSFPQIITSIGPRDYSKRFNEKGLIAAFKEAGYQTYWITNQPYYPNSLYYMYANISDDYKDVSTTFEMISYDSKILPYFEKIIQNKYKKRLIIIHTIGSHYRYNLRHPLDFEKYKPVLDGSISISGNGLKHREKYHNSYDNSILYTDFFLSELIHKMSNIKEQSLLMYLSDHGENLFDDKRELFLHGTAVPSKYELEIPMFIWTSDTYNTTIVAKLKASTNKKLSSEIVFHSLSSLGVFQTNLHKSAFDLLSDSLKYGNRLFLMGDGEVINIDADNFKIE